MRLFGQFQKVNSAKFAGTEFSEVHTRFQQMASCLAAEQVSPLRPERKATRRYYRWGVFPATIICSRTTTGAR